MSAICLHDARLPAGAAREIRPGRRAARVLATLREWRRRARDREQLTKFDDRMLSDIGLTRADAEFLGNKPFWRE